MPAIWAIADLHLSYGVPNKGMEVFGAQWSHHGDKIKENWIQQGIQPDDLILIAGDISWGMRLEEARPDLDWIHQLPGTKVIIRGNHDYWWSSLSQIAKICPPSIHLIQNNVFNWNGVSVGGARLWDTPEYSFGGYIEYAANPRANLTEAPSADPKELQKIWEREISRLEMSLKGLDKNANMRLAMTHYPPISADLKDSQAAKILEKYNVDICVFGHLHNVNRTKPMFGEKNGVRYVLTACDYLDFKPVKLTTI